MLSEIFDKLGHLATPLATSLNALIACDLSKY